MAKYEVIVTETLEHTVEIEANSRKEAKEKAYEILCINGSQTDYDTESLGTQFISAEKVDDDGDDDDDDDGFGWGPATGE